LDSLTRIQQAIQDQNDLLAIHEFESLEKINSQMILNEVDSPNFQDLFYSTWQSAESYFKNTQIMGIADDSLPVVMAGLDQLASAYSGLFWSSAQNERTWLGEQSQNYFYLFGAGFVVLIFLALYTSLKIYRYLHYQERREDLLSIVGTRDLNTGLFNRMSFDTLALQEMSRAKRRGYGFSVLLLRIERYEQVVADFGQLAGDRLLYQVSEILKTFKRYYDGVFKYSENCFSIVLVEVDREKMRSIETRLNEKFSEKSFIITHDQIKIVPRLTVGFAVYPYNGTELQELLQVAEQSFHETVADVEDDSGYVTVVSSPDSFFEGARARAQDEESALEMMPQEVVSALPPPESVESIIEKYSAHTSVQSEVLEEVAAANSNKIPMEELPDVILALTQDEKVLQKMANESLEKKRSGSHVFGNIPQIEIVKDEQQEDIIMVNFDRNKGDLAEKFRRRLKTQKEL
jgi:diguanylate cyclase (GGDEF)-like protein